MGQLTSVIIVGGGLCGLSLAHALLAQGQDFQVLEGRDRIGGRVLTRDGLDLGPAWIWPGQPRIEALLNQLDLTPFEQFSTGDLLHEDAAGQVQRFRGRSGMEGALRVPGGLGAVATALADRLPPDTVRTGCHVQRIETGSDMLRLDTSTGPIETERCVLTLPPRIAAGLLPDLAADTLAALRAIPTWMAGHAKAVATYDQPFWRDAGLSGDAFSRRGPMVEMHDASTPNGAAALFGFIGVPPAARRKGDALQAAILKQFAHLFGPGAERPNALYLQDWAFDPFTATAADQAPLHAHPQYGPLPDPVPGRLLIAGTEMAQMHGGLVEGALEAAEAAFDRLTE
ncbi:MAG: FAD-dependent oxidoreductase [Pseudomonadota bacterium]